MNTLLSRAWNTLRSPAMLFFVLVVAVSFVGRRLPVPWDDFVRRLISLVILYVILWLAFRARVFGHQLQRHLDEITAMLQARADDITSLQQTAIALKTEAADLAENTRQTAQITHDKIDELGTQIAVGAEASRAAEHAANDSKLKLDDTKSEIRNLNTRLIEQGKDSHDKLDTIEQVTTESNQILKTTVKGN